MLKPYVKPKPPTLETPDVVEPIQKEQEVKFIYLKGDKGEKGEPGDRRTDKEVQDLIKPLIPQPISGKDGKNGNDGKDGKNGQNGKSFNPEQIRDFLENLKKGKKLSIQAIDGLSEILQDLSKTKTIVTGSSNSSKGSLGVKFTPVKFIDDETPSGTIDAINTDFVLSRVPASGSVKVYRGGARQRVTEDYTIAHKTITFLVAPEVGEVILVDYRVN